MAGGGECEFFFWEGFSQKVLKSINFIRSSKLFSLYTVGFKDAKIIIWYDKSFTKNKTTDKILDSAFRVKILVVSIMQ